MSFRRFVCWCALCGGWAALVGWAMGQAAPGDGSRGEAGFRGLFLGLLIALALGLVDALWVFSLRQVRQIAPRVLVCTAVGAVGGLVGGFVGQVLLDWTSLVYIKIAGWVLAGLLVGVSLGTFDFLAGWVREENLRGAGRKVLRGALGGAVGGLLGGLADWGLGKAWDHLLPGRPDLLSPSATGFVALGACIGLMIALAQVVLREAWLRVEAGFRKGRELPLNKAEITIGRAESCDVGLFGDAAVSRLHARILRQGNRYLIADAAGSGGTFVNDVQIQGPTPLRSGDLIRMGASLLRFRDRQKRRA